MVTDLLIPSSSSSTSALALMSNHILALKCFTVLPKEVWDGKLGEGEMEVLMEGLNSPDDYVRSMVSSVGTSIALV